MLSADRSGVHLLPSTLFASLLLHLAIAGAGGVAGSYVVQHNDSSVEYDGGFVKWPIATATRCLGLN
jgi:hypothetical protein